jgi:putative nucleotidyltransferase with HDIG domain
VTCTTGPRQIPLEWVRARAREARCEARWSESIAWAAIGLVEAARQGYPAATADFLNGVGAIAFERGDMKGAERGFAGARRIALSRGYEAAEAAALVNLGAVATVRGRFGEAIDFYRRARQAQRRVGNAVGEARALNNLGMLFADLKRWRAATRSYRLARQRALESGSSDLLGLIALNATEVFLETGDLASACESCDEAVGLLSNRDPLAAAEAQRLYGQIHRRTGRLELAEIHLERASSLGRKLDAPLTEAEALRELGLLHMARGRHRGALESFGRSLKLFRGLDAAHDLDEVRSRIEDLEAIIVRIVEQLGREVEAKDVYLHGHSSRVAEYAAAIACDLGFDPDEMRGVLVAGYLHDIGKLRIDPAILNKKGRLTEAEMDEVRRHPILGVEHLLDFELPWNVEAAIRGHHERYDGTGYPDRLVGEAIPLGARILLVADVFDALTTARSYRLPWSREQALTYLEVSTGTLSDPVVTAVFLDVARRESFGHETAEDPGDPVAMRPEEWAAAFAALPRPEEWERLDEEFARV